MVDLKLSLPDVAGTRRGQLTLKVGGETDSEDILGKGFRPQHRLLSLPVPQSQHEIWISSNRCQQLTIRTVGGKFNTINV